MIIKIAGIKYNFQIVSEKEGCDYSFFIRAEDNCSRKTSCINNLNAILSMFQIKGNDPQSAESMWIVNRKKRQYLVKSAKESLSDSSFLEYLERRVDEDREAGEWENTSGQNVLD